MSQESCCSKLKEMFLRCDFFYTTEFLRYRSQPQYRTYTGACCSMIIVVTFLSIFTNVLLSTFSKTNLTFNMSTIDESTSSLTVSTSINNTDNAVLMFAVGIENFDLNDLNYRYFDLRFKVIESANKSKATRYIDLQPCSVQNWNITSGVAETYARLNFDTFLCAPTSLQFSLQGKYIDSIFNYVQIQINKCSPLLNLSRPCANDTYILSQISSNNFLANIYFLNSYIHPDREDSVEYYIEDRNYLQFNYQFGGLVNLFVSRYQITTDHSIWPIQEKESAKGGYVDQIGQYMSYQHDGQTLAQFFIRRQSNTLMVQKQYTKLDDTLSYIGGLFGFIMSILIFFQKYTQSCYQIDAGGTLYQHDHQTEIDKDNFNLFWYLGYLVYLLCKEIGLSISWPRMQIYDHCREQIQKQFDVCFLFERITFLERSVRILFSQEQFKMLFLQKRPTLKEAEESRSNYQSPIKFRKPHQENCERTDSLVNRDPNSMSVIDVTIEHQDDVSQVESKRSTRSVKGLRKGLSILKKESIQGDEISQRIITNLDKDITSKIEQCLGQSHSRDQNYQARPVEVQVSGDNLNPLESQSSNVIRVQPIEVQSNIGEDGD